MAQETINDKEQGLSVRTKLNNMFQEIYNWITNFSITWDDVDEKPDAFPPEAHNQDWSTIENPPSTYPPEAHNQDWSTIENPPSTYPDTDAIHKSTSAEISAITEKTTPSADDLFLIEDSAASNAKKKLKYSNIMPVYDTYTVNTYKSSFEVVIGKAGSIDSVTLPAGVTLTSIAKNGVVQTVPFAVVVNDLVALVVANSGAYPVVVTVKNKLSDQSFPMTVTTGAQTYKNAPNPFILFYIASLNRCFYLTYDGIFFTDSDDNYYWHINLTISYSAISSGIISYINPIVDGNILLFAHNNGLYRIDLVNKTISLSSVAITAKPFLVYNSTKIYALSANASILKFDRTTYAYLGTIAGTTQVFHITYSAVNDSVYYFGGAGSIRYKFDCTTETLVGCTINIGSNCAIFCAVNNYLYSGTTNLVNCWNPVTDSLVTTIGVSGTPSGMCIVGNFLYVSTTGNVLYKINVTTNTVTTSYVLISRGNIRGVYYNQIDNSIIVMSQASGGIDNTMDIIYL